jgi:hypothetical protein
MDNHKMTTYFPNQTNNIFDEVLNNVNQPISIDSNLKKKKKNRCFKCNKKLGILGFECKCKIRFCSSHLTPEIHNCTFDYKSEKCKQLEKTLVKVVADKIIRI